MTAKEDINIIGTTVAANGDVDADATNINILSAEEVETSMNKDASLTQTVRAGIGNAWVDTAHSAVDAYESVQDSINSDESGANTAAKVLKRLNQQLKWLN